jgi:hypothetical protein
VAAVALNYGMGAAHCTDEEGIALARRSDTGLDFCPAAQVADADRGGHATTVVVAVICFDDLAIGEARLDPSAS